MKTKFIKNIAKGIKKHSSAILIGLGITGGLVTVGLTIPATVKSVKDVEAEKKRLNVEKLTPKQTIKATYKNYIWPAATFIASTGCVIGGVAIPTRKSAALASTCTLIENSYSAYRANTKKIVGAEREKEIAEETKKDISDSVMFFGPHCLCYDEPTKRFFRSSYGELMKIKADLATRFPDEMIITVHDISDEFGLDRTDGGDRMGFDINKNRFDMKIERAGVSENGEPYLIIDYTPIPLR